MQSIPLLAGETMKKDDEASTKAPPPSKSGFTYWVGVSFCVNYIMGCGFLAIPYNFAHSGVLLGPLVVLVFAVIMNISKDFVLEAMGRAEYLATLLAALRSNVKQPVEDGEGGSGGVGVGGSNNLPFSASGESSSTGGGSAAGGGALELSPLPPSTSTSGTGKGLHSYQAGSSSSSTATTASLLLHPSPASYLVSHTRRFEVADLFSLLLGSRSRVIYVVVLSGYMYGALWAYGTVFANSFSANIPVVFANGGATCEVVVGGVVNSACLGPFYTWLGTFALVAIPLSCMELTEQVGMQVLMFGARVLVVVLMVGTVVVGWGGCGGGGVVFADPPLPPGPQLTPSLPPGLTLFSFSGLPALLPVATYAFIFHHSVPVLAHPIAVKESLPSLFRSAFLVCCVAYGALGLLVSLGFGEGIKEQCNLNWGSYVGCVMPGVGGAEAIKPSSASPLAFAIRFVILIFPALDVLSAYPLNAITLGNNLAAACSGLWEPKNPGGGYVPVTGTVESPGGEEEKEKEEAGAEEGGEEAEGDEEGGSTSGGGGGGGGGGEGRKLTRGNSASGGTTTNSSKTSRGWVRSWLPMCTPPMLLRTTFRLLAAVPPIAAGALSTASGINLDQILRWTGLIGVAIAFFIPSLLRAAAYARSKAVFKVLQESAARSGSGGGGGGGGEEDEEGREALARAAEKAMTAPLTLADLFLDSPIECESGGACEKLRGTPYTSWCTGVTLVGGVRGDGLMALFSIAMAGYVFWGLLENKA